MGRLCAGDFVGVNDARTLGDPNSEGFDVGHSLIKRSVRFRISHSLIRLGHSTVVLTLDTYSHVIPTMQQAATARLEKLITSQEDANESDPTVTQAQNAG